jgi:hypothetical protein
VQFARCLAHLSLQIAAGFCEVNARGPTIVLVRGSANQVSLLQPAKHGGDGVRIGETTAYEVLLRHAVFFCQQGEQNELVCGRSMAAEEALE